MKGTITRWIDHRGFGFIKPDEGDEDVFLHFTEIVEDSYLIEEGKKIEFDVRDSYKGPRAVNARILI